MLGDQEAVRMDMSPNSAISDQLSGSKPRMHSFETLWWISCSKFKRSAMIRRAVGVPGSEHYDADSLRRGDTEAPLCLFCGVPRRSCGLFTPGRGCALQTQPLPCSLV